VECVVVVFVLVMIEKRWIYDGAVSRVGSGDGGIYGRCGGVW